MAVAPVTNSLPRLRHPDEGLVRWAEDLVRGIEFALNRIQAAAGQAGYTTTAVTESRTLNPTTATLPQTGQALATVILDLQRKGFLG